MKKLSISLFIASVLGSSIGYSPAQATEFKNRCIYKDKTRELVKVNTQKQPLQLEADFGSELKAVLKAETNDSWINFEVQIIEGKKILATLAHKGPNPKDFPDDDVFEKLGSTELKIPLNKTDMTCVFNLLSISEML